MILTLLKNKKKGGTTIKITCTLKYLKKIMIKRSPKSLMMLETGGKIRVREITIIISFDG